MKFFFTSLLSLAIILTSNSMTFPENSSMLVHGIGTRITILFDKNDEETVKIAAECLANDLQLITGIKTIVSSSPADVTGDAIIIGSLNGSNFIQALEYENIIDLKDIKGKWETYKIKTVNNPTSNIENAIIICGSDKRGTAFGVFDLSKRLGISPWHWWADVHPAKQEQLIIPKIDYTSLPPSVKYRGIFLNDECWGLNPWASNTFEPEENNIGPKTYAKIFELLLRLKGNFIWPAMHPCTNAFYKNPDNPKTADAYGIVVGSSHAEPMLRNNVDEWDHDKYGEYNWLTNQETVLNYWKQRVIESKDYESIYTMGMRGIHDSGMVGASTMEERVAVLQEIIKEQRNLIKNHVKPEVDIVPQAFTTYKEVLDIYDAGMELPDDITLVWPDDNYGYIHRFSDDELQQRVGGSGIYYHISYWGRPHDYLWISSTHPSLIWQEMIKASYFNSNEIWVVNVGDIKPLEYGVSLFLDMAYNTDKFSTSESARKHLYNWHKAIFGDETGRKIAGIIWEYYDINFERRPEFMGWSQTEPTRKTHFTEYNHFEAGDEAQKRIDSFNRLYHEVQDIKPTIPIHLSDAFFQLVEYPVACAGLMSKKFLYMEKAYYYASQYRSSANDYALMSKAAYDSIAMYTNYYNHDLSGGKWNDMMYMQPRSLPVFDMPLMPKWDIPENNNWGLATEGDEEIRRIKDIKGPLNLPVFSKITNKEHLVDIFMKGDQPVEWNARPSDAWIKISEKSGLLDYTPGNKQKRLWVSIDWDKVPDGDQARGRITFSSAGKELSVSAIAIKPNISEDFDSHLFVENNRYLSIYAESYNRVNQQNGYRWELVDGLGYTGKSVWANPLEERTYSNNINLASTIEYDFYTWSQGDIEVTIYCIPVHPVNQHHGVKFGVSVNDEEVQIVDHQTFGRSEEWKLNVLRNSAIVKTGHQLASPGKQVLKIHALDPGVIIDRITIDTGGLIKTYSVLPETKVSKK